jgi:uncharacterized protein YbjQ (UPF0145 family)
MKVSTTCSISGFDVSETIGVVNGSIVKAKHVFRDIGAGLKTIIGGEIKGYTMLMNEARKIAYERMVKEAESLGADGIVGFRYVSTQVMAGASEILAYGTAVKLKKS